MNPEKELERAFRTEIRDIAENVIIQTDDGSYEAFGKYRIKAENRGYRVHCWETDAGLFTSTRTALAFCIADKFKSYNLAREIQESDQKLGYLINDIGSRATRADRSKNPDFREVVETKLASKIIRKKKLEEQLNKCIKTAKYLQEKGFTQNEINRTGRNQAKQTSR